ncbi:type II secretion system protein GspL [Yersinia sp. 2553 StPb PI]|uniref:type II secretion system protein GspL n=1 Tax=Yersinia sp. 2553 StPb PI TaxID=3117411 RepID=UPI003FA45F69
MNSVAFRATLLIRLGNYEHDSVYWYIKTHDGKKSSYGKLKSHTEIKNLKLDPKYTVKILVPASCIIFRRIDIKGVATSKNMKVISFLLEESIVDDIDKFHTINLKCDDDFCYVAAVEHQLMNRWIGWLKDADITAKTIVPDVLALPFSLGQWFAVKLDHEWLIRDSEMSGFSICSEILEKIYASRLSSVHKNTFYPASSKAINWQSTQYCDVLRVMAENVAHTDVNLLCGKYNNFFKRIIKCQPIFKPIFLCLLLSIFVCLNYGVDRYKIMKDIDMLNVESTYFYTNFFPVNESDIDDISHFNDYIGHHRDMLSKTSFLDLMHKSGVVIDRFNLHVNSVNFNRDTQMMSYNISTSEPDAIAIELNEGNESLKGVILNKIANGHSTHDIIFNNTP